MALALMLLGPSRTHFISDDSVDADNDAIRAGTPVM